MGERPPSGTRQPAIHGWTTGDWQPTGGNTHVFRPSPSQNRKSLGKEGRWGGGGGSLSSERCLLTFPNILK